MNKQVVYLIRHASPRYLLDSLGRRLVYGPTAELADEGKLQSVRLAHRIRQREARPLDILVTSPYTRAAQTAATLSREMGMLTIVKDDRLRDTRSTWEGVLMDEFLSVFAEGKTFDDPRTLETVEALGARMKAAYDEILLRFEGKNIGIVSHGDPLRALWFRLFIPQGSYPPYPVLTKMVSLDTAQSMRIEQNQEGSFEPKMELI